MINFWPLQVQADIGSERRAFPTNKTNFHTTFIISVSFAAIVIRLTLEL